MNKISLKNPEFWSRHNEILVKKNDTVGFGKKKLKKNLIFVVLF